MTIGGELSDNQQTGWRAGHVLEKGMVIMTDKMCQIWDMWIADTGTTGISFGRGRLDPTDVLLVHAAPAQLNLEVRDDTGLLLASGNDLLRTASTPISRLRRDGNRILREDIWPTQVDYGTPVLLPGGEVGILQDWWNDADHQEWRWRVEFYNHR
jgi:hypothetical protein